MSRKSSTGTLIAAMRILARDIQGGDGVANAAIAEAAERLAEQQVCIIELKRLVTEHIELDRQWDVQRVGKLCGAPLGTSIRAAVEPALVRLVAENEQLQSRIKELEHQAAIGRRAVAVLSDIDRDNSRRRGLACCPSCGDWDGHHALCELAAILRDAELANNRVILDSSDHARGATKMVADRQLADAVNELRNITAAADAVIQRWHTPLWKDARPTAEYVAALRLAAESARKLLAGDK